MNDTLLQPAHETRIKKSVLEAVVEALEGDQDVAREILEDRLGLFRNSFSGMRSIVTRIYNRDINSEVDSRDLDVHLVMAKSSGEALGDPVFLVGERGVGEIHLIKVSVEEENVDEGDIIQLMSIVLDDPFHYPVA